MVELVIVAFLILLAWILFVVAVWLLLFYGEIGYYSPSSTVSLE